MSNRNPPKSAQESNPADIYCPDCDAHLAPELVQLLLNGNTVYCEMCGFPFVGIEDGEVKPLKRSPNQRFDTPILSKSEKQWIKWKKVWKKLKTNLAVEFQELSDNLKKEMGEVSQDMDEFSHEMDEVSHEMDEVSIEFQRKQPKQKRIHIVEKSTPSSSPVQDFEEIPHPSDPFIPRSHNSFNSVNFNPSIHILTQITPFYYVLIIFLTFLALIRRNLSGVGFASAILIEIFIILQEFQNFQPQIRTNQVKHAGIPMIILGFFSIRAFGIGLSLFVRGILCILAYIQKTRTESPRHPAIRENELIKPLWTREIVRSIGLISPEFLVPLFLSRLLGKIDEYIYYNGKIGSLIWISLSGVITLFVFYLALANSFKEVNLRQIPPTKGTIAIVFGFIAFGADIGIVLLLWGLFFLYYYDLTNKLSKPMPPHADIRDIKYKLVVVPESREDPSFSHTEKQFSPSSSTDELSDWGNDSDKSSHLHTQKLADSSPNSSDKNQDDTLQFIYTILLPEQRARLLNLNMTKDEKDIITRALIYMSQSQQNLYLDELESINTEELIPADLIQRIYALPLPTHQYKALVDQLHYLPLEEQSEYVEFLENSVK